jgi:DNA mismatch endonuclease (patch repair protein)
MSRIRGKDTRIEVAVRKYLFSRGYRYRKNDKRLPGHPDIVLPKYRTVIFINGCFWHGHAGCKYFVWPRSNIDYWKRKICSNTERDKQTYVSLEELGWKVVIIWECQLKKDKLDSTLFWLLEILNRNPTVGGNEAELF